MTEHDEIDDETPAESALGVELYSEYWGRGEEIGQLQAEKEHNRRVFGQTYREVNGRDHKRCVVLCLNPGQRKPVRCPCCYGKAGFRPMHEGPPVEPIPTRGERLAAWLGGCLAAFQEAITMPFRVSREHRVALIRDVLQDAMNDGLTAEVVRVCPSCDARELAELDQAVTTMTAEVITQAGE
jgi:hypothetical protein